MSASGWATRPQSGCPSCARRSPAGSAGDSASMLDPGRRHPHARLEGGDLLLRAGRARSGWRQGHGRPDGAGLPGLRARRAVRRRARRARSRSPRRTAFSPISPPSRPTRGAGPHSSGSTTRTTRRALRAARLLPPAGGARASSTTSCSPPTRRTRSSGSTSRRHPRCSSAISRTWRCSTRCRSAPR